MAQTIDAASGQPIQPVTIVGANSGNGSLGVDITTSDAMIPVDLQNHTLDPTNPIPVGGGYLDLGLLDAGALAAGSTAYYNASPFVNGYVTGVQWVRNVLVMETSDQTARTIIVRQDSSGTADYGYAAGTTDFTVGTSNTSYQDLLLYGSAGTLGTSGILGYGVKIGLKNTSVTNATWARLRVQLMG